MESLGWEDADDDRLGCLTLLYSAALQWIRTMSGRPTSKRSVDGASSSVGATAQKRHPPSEAALPSSAP